METENRLQHDWGSWGSPPLTPCSGHSSGCWGKPASGGYSSVLDRPASKAAQSWVLPGQASVETLWRSDQQVSWQTVPGQREALALGAHRPAGLQVSARPVSRRMTEPRDQVKTSVQSWLLYWKVGSHCGSLLESRYAAHNFNKVFYCYYQDDKRGVLWGKFP